MDKKISNVKFQMSSRVFPPSLRGAERRGNLLILVNRLPRVLRTLAMTKQGFTLAEILVVIAIVAIVGTLLVAIFIATLRGSNKAQILSVIKQNGQSVLENLDKTIRSADKVICPVSSDSPSPILVLEKNTIYTRFIFIAESGSVNGKIIQDNPTPSDPFNCTDQTLVNPVTLTDTNTQSGVSVSSTNASFIRNISTGSRDQVTVVFDLKPGLAAPAAVAGQIDPVTFQTTVQLRND